jgi:hypothetical protein
MFNYRSSGLVQRLYTRILRVYFPYRKMLNCCNLICCEYWVLEWRLSILIVFDFQLLCSSNLQNILL